MHIKIIARINATVPLHTLVTLYSVHCSINVGQLHWLRQTTQNTVNKNLKVLLLPFVTCIFKSWYFGSIDTSRPSTRHHCGRSRCCCCCPCHSFHRICCCFRAHHHCHRHFRLPTFKYICGFCIYGSHPRCHHVRHLSCCEIFIFMYCFVVAIFISLSAFCNIQLRTATTYISFNAQTFAALWISLYAIVKSTAAILMILTKQTVPVSSFHYVIFIILFYYIIFIILFLLYL